MSENKQIAEASKVLGASAASIVATLTGEFIKPVIIATLMAFPLAWWGMNQWLQEFAYRITINGGEFVLAGFFCTDHRYGNRKFSGNHRGPCKSCQ